MDILMCQQEKMMFVVGVMHMAVLLPLERGFFLSGISQNIKALWIPSELLVFGDVVFCLFVFSIVISHSILISL